MITPLASPSCPVFLSGRFLNRPSQPLGVVLLRFKFPFSFLLSFFPIIYLHAPYIFLCAQIATVSMSLKRRFSLLLSPRACLPILFFFFFSRCALVPSPTPLAFSRPSFSLSPRTCVPSSPARSQLPSIGFSSFRLLLIALAATPLTGVSGRANSLLRPLTSHDSGNLAFALFFRYNGFLRPVRVDFFLIRTRACVHPPCIKVSFRSSGFFYHDNVPGYFRVYFSTVLFSPCFIVPSCLTHVSAHDISWYIAYSGIISRVISHVPRMVFSLALPLPSPLLTSPTCVRTFCALLRAASVRSIYGVFTFSRGSSPLHHVCSRVGYCFPIAPNFLLHI